MCKIVGSQEISCFNQAGLAGGEIQTDKIRVAYLSADFHEHPASYLLAGVFSSITAVASRLLLFRLDPTTRVRCEQD